jgi:hypothetical protein
MYRRQRGVTAIGWLFLLLPIAIVGYAGIRLTPVYLNYMKVARALDQLEKTSASDYVNVRAVQTALERYFDIDGVTYPDARDLVVKRDSGNWIVQAQYDDTAPLFSNVSILVQFDKTATVR